MTSTFNRAFTIWVQYKTQTPQYKALALQMGYSNTGDLNAIMAAENYRRNQKA